MVGCAGGQQEQTGSFSETSTATGKMAVNFEGRVAAVESDRVTLEDGTVVLTGQAAVSTPDGSAGEIAVGDYIQGYAENPEGDEVAASAILITTL